MYTLFFHSKVCFVIIIGVCCGVILFNLLMGKMLAGLPSVPYLTVQYRILALVPSVPYSTDNIPFFEQ